MNKVAIIGPHHQDGWDVLQKMNLDVFEITDLSKNNLIKELKDVEGIALRTTKLDEEILSKCSKLKNGISKVLPLVTRERAYISPIWYTFSRSGQAVA